MFCDAQGWGAGAGFFIGVGAGFEQERCEFDLLQLDGEVQGPLDLSLYNLQGGLVYSERSYARENIVIRTDHLASGVYFLQLRTGHSIKSMKLVKMEE